MRIPDTAVVIGMEAAADTSTDTQTDKSALVNTRMECRPDLQRKDGHMKTAGMKKIFVCSPFRGIGNTEEAATKDYRHNIALAKGVCRYITEKGGVPYCPHLYFPRFLTDSDPDEREIGMLMGQTWLAQCDELWVIGRRISKGMAREIARAEEWGIPVKHYVLQRTPEERLLDAILRPEVDYHELV